MANNTIQSYAEKIKASTDPNWLKAERKRILLAMKEERGPRERIADAGRNMRYESVEFLEICEQALFDRLNRILPEQDKTHTLRINGQGTRLVISLFCFETGDHL